MRPPPQQLQELHELSPVPAYDPMDYFTTKEYVAYKRRKAVMKARMELENEIDEEESNRIVY